MITRPSAAVLVVLVLLAVLGQSSGFVVAKRSRHGSSSGVSAAGHSGEDIDSGARLVPALDHLTLAREASYSSYSSESSGLRTLPAWALKSNSKPATPDRSEDGAEAVVQPRPGMETQLGGWSYARTVLTNRIKSKDGAGGDEGTDGSSGAGSASTAAQSAGGGGGHSSSDSVTGDGGSGGAAASKGTGAGGGDVGQGGDDDSDGDGDGDDDDDESKEEKEGQEDGLDSWDLSEFGSSQDGLNISFSEEGESAGAEAPVTPGSAGTVGSGNDQGDDAAQEYEVVCDGDVCERRPVGGSGGAQLAQAVASTSAGVDARDDALAAASSAALGDGAGVEGEAGGAATLGADSSAGADAAGDTGDAASATAAAVAAPSESGGGSGAAVAVAGAGAPEGSGEGDGDDGVPSPADNPDVAQLVSMGWELEESAAALAQSGGDVVGAAEALAAQEEEDLERYEEGLADLQQRGWDSDVAMSAMREAGGNSTAALLALEEEDRMLSLQFEQSIEEMVEHGWDEEVARKALLMQWQKDIEGGGGSRKAQKQFEKTVKGVHEKGVREGKTEASGGGGGGGKKKKDEPPAPTPAKREDVVFEVTDKTLQKVVLESPVPVILDVYAEWCGPCKQLTPALEDAAIRSGGMFRVAKVDAEKQKGIAEVLGIKAFPSVFGVKDGIILDNFVGGLPQDEMQAFMMGVVMGIPPPKDKELREHQKGQAELRGISRKLAHVAGLAVLGSRKKESLCIKVDKALSEMLPAADGSTPSAEDASAVAAAKKAARTVVTVLMSAYKFPEDPKYRSLSTSSKVYEEVLAPHPPMLEALRLAGFRHKDGDESRLTLLHRNMAVLASVQDRVEVWNKSVKMPEVAGEDSEDEYDSEEEDEEELERLRQVRARLATVAKLEITDSSGSHEAVVKMEMEADSTVGELFQVLQEDEGFGDDLVLTTAFPKRELAASDPTCRSSTLQSLGLTPSARLTATTAAALAAAAEKEAAGDDAQAAAARKEGLKAKMMDKSRDGTRKGSKKAGSLFGASDGIIEVKKGKHQEYFGGDSTVTLAAEDTEEEEDEGEENASTKEDDFGQASEGGVSLYSEEDPSSFSDERGQQAAATSIGRGEGESSFSQESEDSGRESDGEPGTSASEFSASEEDDESSGGESSAESGGTGRAGSEVGGGAGGDESYDASAEEDEGSYDVDGSDEYGEGGDDDVEDGFVADGSVSYDGSYSSEEGEEELPVTDGKLGRGRQRDREGGGDDGEGSSYDDDGSYDDGGGDEEDVDSYYDESFSSEERDGGRGHRGSQGMPKDTKRS